MGHSFLSHLPTPPQNIEEILYKSRPRTPNSQEEQNRPKLPEAKRASLLRSKTGPHPKLEQFSQRKMSQKKTSMEAVVGTGTGTGASNSTFAALKKASIAGGS